jgi:hypothetical protein
MKYAPMPTQVVGAAFLAERRRALLGDEQRVGKTGTAIMAADKIQAERILVVTTASGRAVWRKAFPAWSHVKRPIAIVGVDKQWQADQGRCVVIVSWNAVNKITPRFGRTFDVIILDESHYAKNPTAARTRSTFGWFHNDGAKVIASSGVIDPLARVWHLSGTPFAHDLSDIYTTLRASAPERLFADPARGWPDVLTYSRFRKRYCIIRPKQLSSGQWIDVVVAGQNENELRDRMKGFMLRRTQADIGALPPRYETLPITVLPAARRALESDAQIKALLNNVENGAPLLDDSTSRIMRLTGVIKAPGVAAAAADELDNGLDRLVIAYVNTEVGDTLHDALRKYGVARTDGATSLRDREFNVSRFTSGDARVFLGQIAAAKEAIDLSAACELWFAQSVFTPADMQQMAARIVNVSQKRTPIVRLCYIDNSIDEALQATVARLSFSIGQVLR